MVKVAPSILSCDFARLHDCVKKVEGADFLHVDVMDGRFVPNITIGQPVVVALKKVCDIPLDVHLMIENPEKHLDSFIESGADMLTVHAEASVHMDRTLNYIRSCGIKAGVALNPSTPVNVIENVLYCVDMVLVMSVNPGFGGQKFIQNSLNKIREIKSIVGNRQIMIEVDGGINEVVGKECFLAGADILVAGNYIFNSDDPKSAIKKLRFFPQA